MMRPMKLAGSELMFGAGCLAYLKTVKATKASIVIGGSSMERSGILDKVRAYLAEGGVQTDLITGVEPDPHFSTVRKGVQAMKSFQPDLIIALGGGSVMDAAKTMWIYYENEQLTKLADILPPNAFPKLRKKARFCCIPSTSGTASEVSRSVVITDDDTGMKVGLGNMEMMPDIAICDPEVTLSMPQRITAETGMDALTHALEALVSNRANYISNILATKAAQDIIATLPTAYHHGDDLAARGNDAECFNDCRDGVLPMFHWVSSIPWHIRWAAIFTWRMGWRMRYCCPILFGSTWRKRMPKKLTIPLPRASAARIWSRRSIRSTRQVNIPSTLGQIIPDKEKYFSLLDDMALAALADGCTKTNPIIPTVEQLKNLYAEVYGNA